MSGVDRAASLAAAMLRFRRVRSEHLSSDIFGEPAWDLLLELFVADAEGRRLTGLEVCRSARIQPSVMSRWLRHLTKIGMVVGDGSGDLGDELTLSGAALHRIEELLSHAQELKRMME